MNDYAWAGQISPVLAIAAGLLVCFWGYRLVKLSLSLIGFCAGAYGGWELGLLLAHGNAGIALICAGVGGFIGMGLCLWFFKFGVFLLGAAAGTVVAAAIHNGAGPQLDPKVLFALPLVFGIVAVLAQKFMIVLCTAFSGAYLVTAGLWPYVVKAEEGSSSVWLHPSRGGAVDALSLGALAFWLVLALVGVSLQFRAGRRKTEVKVEQASS